MRQAGGDNRKRSRVRVVELDSLPEMPETPEECEAALRWCVRAIATGKLDAQTGRAVSDTLRTLHAAQMARLGLEKRAKDLEKKLDAIAKGATT